jgi:hydrogenase maturation protease
MTEPPDVVVVGMGNVYRGDDGVGLAVAERIREAAPPGVRVLECEQEPTRLLDAWQGAEAVVVVDAVAPMRDPGMLHRYDATGEPLPARVFRSSTHAFGVGDAIEVGRALGRLPAHVIVYGIEGQSFDLGGGLSAPVAAAVEPTAAAVLADVQRFEREETPCTSGR